MKADPKLRPGDVLVRMTAAGQVVQRYLLLPPVHKGGRLRLQEPGGHKRTVDWETVGDLPRRWHRESAGGRPGPAITYEIRTRLTSRYGRTWPIQGRIEATSPFEALQRYIDARPRLAQMGAIRPGRPGTAIVEARMTNARQCDVLFVAWPAK